MFEQDGRRNQEQDLEEDEDTEDEDGEKKEEKDADGAKEDEPADPDEFDFPTLSDESKRGMATTRMHAIVYHCNHWADAIKNVQEYVNSLSPEEREKRSAVVNGVAEIDAMIRACHGESILDHPKDLEALAQAGKWRRFKKEIEDLYSKRVRAKVAELSSTPGAVTQQTVSELEKIQDSIGKAFAAMIKKAEAELIARTPGGKDGLRLTTTPVPVKHADDLTLEEFVEEHAIPGKPVVIRGLKMINPDKPWTLEHIADACGGVKVRLNTKSATTTNWGGLVDAGQMPLNDFARRVETDPALRTWYLHDWSLKPVLPRHLRPAAVHRVHHAQVLRRGLLPEGAVDRVRADVAESVHRRQRHIVGAARRLGRDELLDVPDDGEEAVEVLGPRAAVQPVPQALHRALPVSGPSTSTCPVTRSWRMRPCTRWFRNPGTSSSSPPTRRTRCTTWTTSPRCP